MNQNENQETPPGFASRVVVSIIVFFGLLIFALIYVAFFAISFSLFQRIAVIVVVILIAVAIPGILWVSWVFNQGKEWKDCK